jgi:elongation factor Ts
MTISAQQVKALRIETGAAMMECKLALEAASGDHSAAAQALKEKGIAVAETREERATNAGRVTACVAGGRGVIVKLLCETDFVAINSEFVALGKAIADSVAETGGRYRGEPAYPGQWPADVTGLLESTTARIREKIVLSSVSMIEAGPGELLGHYEHADGSVAAIVRIRVDLPVNGEVVAAGSRPAASGVPGAIESLAHDVALHIAAHAPRYVSSTLMPKEEKLALRQRFEAEAAALGKPEKVVQAIVEGRLAKSIRTLCLTEQPFVKDEEMTVADRVASAESASGTTLSVTGFCYDSARELRDEPGIEVLATARQG